MSKTYLLFLLAALPLLSGCPVKVDTPRYPTSRPATGDLTGVYRPTLETKALVKDKGAYSEREMSITLNVDGAFQIANMPDWWRTAFGKPHGGFDSGSGTWQTVTTQGWWELQLSFKDTKDFAPPASVGTTRATIIGQKTPYDISLTIGDPDQGCEMRFSKQGSE